MRCVGGMVGARARGAYTEKDVKGIAQAAAKLPKKNSEKKRIVVITQGSMSTIVATPDGVEEYPVPSGVKVCSMQQRVG
jgi:hypothetical protein